MSCTPLFSVFSTAHRGRHPRKTHHPVGVDAHIDPSKTHLRNSSRRDVGIAPYANRQERTVEAVIDRLYRKRQFVIHPVGVDAHIDPSKTHLRNSSRRDVGIAPYANRQERTVEAVIDRLYRKRQFVIHPVGVDAHCQEQDCKQLCKRIVYTFLCLGFMLLEAERRVAERGFQKRRASQSSREMRRLSSCSFRRSIFAIL